MSRNYYRESVWVSWWIWILFIGLIAFLASVLVLLMIFGIPVGTRPALTYALLILIVAFGLIIINFRKLNIIVDSEKIEVSYGIIKKTISLSEVVSCESTMARFSMYGGVGIRLGLDKSLAFTASFGNAVKIVRRNDVPFVFSTNNPRKLSTIIEISKTAGHKS
jgi:hypothetical protein